MQSLGVGNCVMSLFERPLLGDEYSPKKNAPLIFMPVTVVACLFALCGIVCNFIVLFDGPDGETSLPSQSMLLCSASDGSTWEMHDSLDNSLCHFFVYVRHQSNHNL